MDLMSIIIVIAAIALVVFLVVGLIKKTFWMCAVAGVILLLFGFTQPDKLIEIKESIVEIIDTAIDPLSDDNYADIGEEAGIVDKDEMDEIDKDQSDVLDKDGR
jgi:cell division protein FtsW (lipid II flippase)